MFTNLTFGNSASALSSKIRGARATLIDALSKRVMWWMLRMQQVIQQKLSGEVLQPRTGKLRGSINVQPVVVDGNTITGTVEGAGGPAFYGRFHEWGGNGPYEIVPVNKQALAFFADGSSGSARGIMRGLAQGGAAAAEKFAAAGGVVVRSVQHPAIIQRAFMGPSQRELWPEMIADLQKTMEGYA